MTFRDSWGRWVTGPILRFLGGVRRALARLQERLTPAAPTARWIRRTAVTGVIAAGAWFGAESLNFPHGLWLDALVGAVIALVMLALAGLAVAGTGWLLRVADRHLTRTALVALLALAGLLLMLGMPPMPGVPVALVAGLAVILIGASLALARRRPVMAALAGLPAAALLIAGLWWVILGPSPDDPVADLVDVHAATEESMHELLEPGPHPVAFLTYGHGEDRWRPEYADEVAWTSAPVDARDMLDRPSGWQVRLRERWLGYGLDALPLNGRVWYPENIEGPLPLVLVVHGNHDMMDYSDPGYAWLGEHLASRGHVVVSVDENFLNGSIFGGLDRENATRGWMLLKHVEAWRDWHGEPSHPLHERVDLDRVVLVGHSRGGEAAALAAAFNRLDHYPEDARIEFDFDFGIQGVAAIAPVDGQFRPSDKPTELSDVSYFVIHGGMDADVSYFVGDRQWLRTSPDVDRGRFSASLYVHHANHGQFNTTWGDDDTGSLFGQLLNRAALLSGEEQRRIGLLYLTGFTESALARPAAIPEMFCQPGSVAASLPPTLYVARCNDGRRTVLAEFSEDIDLTTATHPGIRLSGRDLDLWKEDDVGFRNSVDRRQTGAFLGWHAAEEAGPARPAYLIEFDEEARAALSPSADATLWLDLAQADRDPPAARPDDGANGNDESSQADDSDAGDSELRAPLDIDIELVDIEGNTARRPLSDFADLLPPLPVRHTRAAILDRERYGSATEPVLKSVAVDLATFAEAGVDLAALDAVRLHFANEDAGVLIIERMALEPGRRDEATR